MATPTYQAIGFAGDRSDFTVAKAAQRLVSSGKKWNIRVTNVSDSGLRISFGDWTLQLLTASADWVASEAKEKAKEFSSYRHSSDVARCRQMVEINTHDDDSEMEHFNDYLLVVETLGRSFRDFYLLEGNSGQWFDADMDSQ